MEEFGKDMCQSPLYPQNLRQLGKSEMADHLRFSKHMKISLTTSSIYSLMDFIPVATATSMAAFLAISADVLFNLYT